ASVREKLERLKAENDLAAAELAVKSRAVALHEQDIKLLDLEIALREKRDQVHDRVLSDVTYTKDPFKGGTLTITDRRIPLNGVITMATAERITERINYFNN